jgi:hypothetical protein
MEPQTVVENSKPVRKQSEVTPRKLRSAITNGSSVLNDVDHRSAWMRRLRDLIGLHMSDLGGDDNASEAERSLVRRAAMLELQLELMDQRIAQAGGEATSAQLADYQRATGALRRLLTSIGLQRRARDVTTPSITEYLEQVRREGEEAEDQ